MTVLHYSSSPPKGTTDVETPEQIILSQALLQQFKYFFIVDTSK